MLGKAVSHFHDRKVIAIKVNITSPPTKKNSMTVPQKTLETKLLKINTDYWEKSPFEFGKMSSKKFFMPSPFICLNLLDLTKKL